MMNGRAVCNPIIIVFIHRGGDDDNSMYHRAHLTGDFISSLLPRIMAISVLHTFAGKN